MAMRVLGLASGGGSTAEAMEQKIRSGELTDVELVAVVCNNGPQNPSAGVWKRMGALGIDVIQVPKTWGDGKRPTDATGTEITAAISFDASRRILQLAAQYGADAAVGLGFLPMIIGDLLEELPVSNFHHGPLPATAGMHSDGITQEVMRQGLDFAGPTIHWMDRNLDPFGVPSYDTGPIIDHEPIPVTDAMRQEWNAAGTATLLKEASMETEKAMIARFMTSMRVELDA